MKNNPSRRGFLGMLAGIAAAVVVGPGVVRRIIAENATPKVIPVPLPDYWYSISWDLKNSNTYVGIDREKPTNEYWVGRSTGEHESIRKIIEHEMQAAMDTHVKAVYGSL